MNKIDQVFQDPIVVNFSERQNQLALVLENVRDEMYDLKMESKKIIYFLKIISISFF